MKRESIHLRSVFLGAFLVAACVVLPGMQFVPDRVELEKVKLLSLSNITVLGIPQAGDMIRIFETTPYTVPVDKNLVLTGVGTTVAPTGTVCLRFDGVMVLNAAYGEGGPASIPQGLVAGPGTSVEVDELGGMTGVAFGYLETL